MAKLDIDVNRRKEPKRPEGLGNNRPNLDYDADRERRFRMRMQSGPGRNRQEAYDDAPRPKHKKNGAKKSKPKQSFFEKYGSMFMVDDDGDDSIRSDYSGSGVDRRLIFIVVGIIVILGLIMFVGGRISSARKEKLAAAERERQEAEYQAWLQSASANAIAEPSPAPKPENPKAAEYGLFTGYELDYSSAVAINNPEFVSQYGIIIDAKTGRVIAEKNGQTVVSPASMTKMMTLLVAVENIPESKLDDKVTVTRDDTDYAYVNDLSSAGYDADEVTTVRDLMYGTILPSGGEASHALAVYVAGSEEAFVELMNKKAAELGLTNTHFTNVSGFYNENHHSTVGEVAIILKACMENDLCRTVMSAHTYTTTPSEQHEEGLEISNWFLRRIEDKYTDGLVYAAKTGFVYDSGNCSASLNQMPSGNQYICVTVNATSAWACIFDHVRLYTEYAK
ncbi:MAG: serine hydrolase [Lachnospiraceae bacterium]|nr:serine hydrolase [Lachnospiraceae bacterium]